MGGGGETETREKRIERMGKRTVQHSKAWSAGGVWVPFHVITDLAEAINVRLPEEVARAREKHNARHGQRNVRSPDACPSAFSGPGPESES